MTTVLLSAGDASGDLHAADLVRELRERNPGFRFAGLGGPAMREAGVELIADQRDLAVGGLFELVGSAVRIFSVWRRLSAALEELRPELVVLVDSGGFNLPFARRVRRRVAAPILYYVAPQVWAWRPGRIRKLAARVDRLAVIFPFEPAVYRDTALAVDYVGHPLVDPLTALNRKLDQRAARVLCGLPERPAGEAGGAVVTLLPGSRRNEISAHLKIQLETARLLHAEDPRCRFLLALAPAIPETAIHAARAAVLPVDFPLKIVSGHAREAILAADVVLAKPGTVTVEAALLERPMVVMGRAHAFTAWILRRALRVDSLSMPNLIAKEPIVPEFLQRQAVPQRLADAVRELLAGPVRDRQLAGLAEVRRALGGGGAVRKACRVAEEMLEAARA